MFHEGEVVPVDIVKDYARAIQKKDELFDKEEYETILDLTNLFSDFVLKKVELSTLEFSLNDVYEDEEDVYKYAEMKSEFPPIICSAPFDGKRIVIDGYHRCLAASVRKDTQILAFVPLHLFNGADVSTVKTHGMKLCNCKHSDDPCHDAPCCLVCPKIHSCGGICSYCWFLGPRYKIVQKHIALFCDGVWDKKLS